jgi:alkylated DNA repair dioxygenase AlkB
MAVAWQPTLLDLDVPTLDERAQVTRTWLDDRSWVDRAPGLLRSSGQLFDLLAGSLPWRQKTRVVWEQEHLEPRLTSGALPLPLVGVLEQARLLLSARYGVDLDSCSANLYRDGRDSVAWHRDRVHRILVDPIVVTLSLGHPRPFLVRPYGGGPATRFDPGDGDLLVMGGSCQHHWEHTVPKVASAGPRISVMLRHSRQAGGART